MIQDSMNQRRQSVKEIRKAVIPAAGLGTRFLPATKAIPKEMLPIVDKPTIQYVVEEAIASGLTDILFVSSKGKSAIADHFDYDFVLDHFLKDRHKEREHAIVSALAEMISVAIVRQKKPLGLGHAVLVAEPFVGDEYFGVFLGDDIIEGAIPGMQQLIDVHKEHGGSVLAVQEVAPEEIERFGIVAVEERSASNGAERLFRVQGLVEKPSREKAPSKLAVIGRYILPGRIFSHLKETRPGALGEIQLTDGISRLLRAGEPVYAYRFEGNRFDAGDRLGFLKATLSFALKREDLGPPLREYLKSIIGSD